MTNHVDCFGTPIEVNSIVAVPHGKRTLIVGKVIKTSPKMITVVDLKNMEMRNKRKWKKNKETGLPSYVEDGTQEYVAAVIKYPDSAVVIPGVNATMYIIKHA